MSAETLAEREEVIEHRVADRMERDHWPGTVVGVQRRGEIFVRARFANLEHRVPMREDTVFRIGSLTKQFTAVSILRLAERGELSLRDDIARFLPEYPTSGRAITVHQLLTHTSGIQNYTQMEAFWGRSRDDLTHEEILAFFQNEPFRFEPGEQFEYCNSGYHLLGLIVERVSGKTYRDFISELAGEAGLSATRYLGHSAVVAHRAAGYVREHQTTRNAPYLSMRLPFAAGALSSTVRELLAWRGALHSGALLSAASLQQMQRPERLAWGESTSYGYGVAIADFEGTPKITHTGGIHGFASVLSTYPAHDLTIAVLTNLGSARPWVLDCEVARLALGLPALETEAKVLPPAELARYAGSYRRHGEAVAVTAADGAIEVMGQRYVPIGDHRFAVPDDPWSEVRFEAGPSGICRADVAREGIGVRLERSSDGEI